MTAIEPVASTSDHDHDPEMVHVACCAGIVWPPRALCGVVLHDPVEVPPVDSPDDCVVCADLVDTDFCPLLGVCTCCPDDDGATA